MTPSSFGLARRVRERIDGVGPFRFPRAEYARLPREASAGG